MKLSKASQKRLDARKRRAEAKKRLDFSQQPTDKISSVSEFQTPVDPTAQISTQVDAAQPSQDQDVAQHDSQSREKSCKHVDRRIGRKAPEAFRRAMWKPGQSGNPGGHHIKTALELSREILTMMREPTKGADYKTRLRCILEEQFRLAMDGDHKAVEFLFNRAFGKEVNLVAIKGDSALPAGVGMQTILQIMRDSGDEQAIAIAAGAERANVVDVENREIAPPIEPDSVMTTTYAESGNHTPERCGPIISNDCETPINIGDSEQPHATYRVLCDVDQPREDAPASHPEPHQGEGCSTDGVAPLQLSPSE